MLCFDASKRCDINAVLNHAYIRGAGGQTVTLERLGAGIAHIAGNQAAAPLNETVALLNDSKPRATLVRAQTWSSV